ncbi:MAG: hypothetical protein K2H72_07350, partial [Muribaculaceae bacterium]|nr:hypothetical protein [Muribaculaceae bacterium]
MKNCHIAIKKTQKIRLTLKNYFQTLNIKEGNQMCHHFAGLIALDTLDVGRFTFYVGRGFTRRGGGAENTAFKTRVPENKGPDAGNYSAASREYHRL